MNGLARLCLQTPQARLPASDTTRAPGQHWGGEGTNSQGSSRRPSSTPTSSLPLGLHTSGAKKGGVGVTWRGRVEAGGKGAGEVPHPRSHHLQSTSEYTHFQCTSEWKTHARKYRLRRRCYPSCRVPHWNQLEWLEFTPEWKQNNPLSLRLYTPAAAVLEVQVPYQQQAPAQGAVQQQVDGARRSRWQRCRVEGGGGAGGSRRRVSGGRGTGPTKLGRWERPNQWGHQRPPPPHAATPHMSTRRALRGPLPWAGACPLVHALWRMPSGCQAVRRHWTRLSDPPACRSASRQAAARGVASSSWSSSIFLVRHRAV